MARRRNGGWLPTSAGALAAMAVVTAATAGPASAQRATTATTRLARTATTRPARPAQPNPLTAILNALFPPPPPPPAAAATTTTIASIQPMAKGSTGPNVQALEQKLDGLQYFLPNVDSTYDDDTAQAVTAFQKTNNLPRTGKVDQSTWSAMQAAKDPAPLVAAGAPDRVEVDLDRQVLFLYENGKLSKIFTVSSGTSETPTPTGDYAIYSKSTGWETSPLGQLYNSQYFVGGYAIHGAKSVPAQPASHGCVRLTMAAADWFPDHVRIGTPVHIQ